MAKAKRLEDITIEGFLEPIVPVGNPSVSIRVSEHSHDVNLQKEKIQRTPERHGINPQSPVVYVSPEIKRVLKLLKAQILIKDGESISESAIVAKALKEYCNNNQTAFYINNITLFDSL